MSPKCDNVIAMPPSPARLTALEAGMVTLSDSVRSLSSDIGHIRKCNEHLLERLAHAEGRLESIDASAKSISSAAAWLKVVGTIGAGAVTIIQLIHSYW